MPAASLGGTPTDPVVNGPVTAPSYPSFPSIATATDLEEPLQSGPLLGYAICIVSSSLGDSDSLVASAPTHPTMPLSDAPVLHPLPTRPAAGGMRASRFVDPLDLDLESSKESSGTVEHEPEEIHAKFGDEYVFKEVHSDRSETVLTLTDSQG